MNGAWTLELGIETGKNIPSEVFVGIMEVDKLDKQTRYKFILAWLPVSWVFCRIECDRYTDINLNFDFLRNSFHESFYEKEKIKHLKLEW